MIRWIYGYVCYLFSSEKNLNKEIKRIVGRYPHRVELYHQALTHRSSSISHAVESNERLEYLGDSILNSCVAEFLYHKYPTENEGFLTKMRSKIVKRKTLNYIADSVGLETVLNTSSEAYISDSMKGNALEAIIGAVFLEHGYAYTKKFVLHRLLKKHLDIHELERVNENYKSTLLEWCQKYDKSLDYKLLAKYRMYKRDRFKVCVLVEGDEVGQADDFNKKNAEQKASKKALQRLGVLQLDQK